MASVLKAAQALQQYQGGHERHVMPHPEKVAKEEEHTGDVRLGYMRPNRLKGTALKSRCLCLASKGGVKQR